MFYRKKLQLSQLNIRCNTENAQCWAGDDCRDKTLLVHLGDGYKPRQPKKNHLWRKINLSKSTAYNFSLYSVLGLKPNFVHEEHATGNRII